MKVTRGVLRKIRNRGDFNDETLDYFHIWPNLQKKALMEKFIFYAV